jgi:hypothetical protein
VKLKYKKDATFAINSSYFQTSDDSGILSDAISQIRFGHISYSSLKEEYENILTRVFCKV